MKITSHTKNRGNYNLDETRYLIDAKTEISLILKLSEIDFKAAIKK